VGKYIESKYIFSYFTESMVGAISGKEIGNNVVVVVGWARRDSVSYHLAASEFFF
jgi:hypothetical protein